MKYAPPEPQDKLPPEDTENINSLLKNFNGDKTKFISENIKGISYSTALEIISAYGENLTAENIRDYIFNDPVSPCVTYVGGEIADFKVRSTQKDKKCYPDLLSAQSAYYAYITAKKSFSEKKAKLSGALNSGIKKLEKGSLRCAENLTNVGIWN